MISQQLRKAFVGLRKKLNAFLDGKIRQVVHVGAQA
jgi:hypothetical protein